MNIRQSYLYQEDVARIIDSKLPICMLNNKNVLVSDRAAHLLGSYLISNLITLKKFYGLNLNVTPWPTTNEYFGCECVKGINKISDLSQKADYVFDIDHEHSRELQQYAEEHKVRYIYYDKLDSHSIIPVTNSIVIRFPNVFGLLQPEKNIIQNTINDLVDEKIISVPNTDFAAINAQTVVQLMLIHGISDETGELSVKGSTINPFKLQQFVKNNTGELNEMESIAIETIKYLRRFKVEEG